MASYTPFSNTSAPWAGLGFRRELMAEMQKEVPASIGFFEVAPENWAGMGGKSGRQLRAFTERYPFVCHGLSLSLGGPGPLDDLLLRRTRDFMREHGITLFTEHLTWCADDSHLYDLLPIPMTEESVRYTAERIAKTQDILGMRIGVENASTYIAPPGSDMGEAEFVRAVIERADCLLHLDVNNIYVNSRNFGFDPYLYLQQLPLARTCYVHVAGHFQEDDGLLIDTHGSDVIDPVWQLLQAAYQGIGQPVPTCLERDFNMPDLQTLAQEVAHITYLQQAAFGKPVWVGQTDAFGAQKQVA